MVGWLTLRSLLGSPSVNPGLILKAGDSRPELPIWGTGLLKARLERISDPIVLEARLTTTASTRQNAPTVSPEENQFIPQFILCPQGTGHKKIASRGKKRLG